MKKHNLKSLLLLLLFMCNMNALVSQKFNERFRPQFHFTPEKNWINDPNGLVYNNGRYHLFYQYNPYGTQWGFMSWGHAVSSDLLHWEHRDVAIPITSGVHAWSGSAMVDHYNTTGFGTLANPPLVAIYTGHVQGQPQKQYLAFSNDDGDNWNVYPNPVLDIGNMDFRDPKVFWYEPAERWIMAVARSVDRVIEFYASENLFSWALLSQFGPTGSVDGVWECPDLFELAIDGDTDNTKWVLQVDVTSHGPAGGSGAQYFIGHFNGVEFIADSSEPNVLTGELFDDFERADHGDWVVTGTAFGSGPVTGTLPDQQIVSGFLGNRLINSYHDGDVSQGSMLSPEFVIGHHYINFLIGGGNHSDLVGVELLIDGVSVRSATGSNSERLDWHSWDVAEFFGSAAQIRIFDYYSGGWGHINIDQIVFSDERALSVGSSVNWVDYGADFYAVQSWSDIPAEDGRRIWLAWMNNWMYAGVIPTSTWRGAMTIPREVSLTQLNGEIRLAQQPIREIETLWLQQTVESDIIISGDFNFSETKGVRSQTLDLDVTFDIGNASSVGVRFDYGDGVSMQVGYDQQKGVFYSDRRQSGNTGFHDSFGGLHEAGVQINGSIVTMRVFLDWSSVEFFAQNGTVVFTNQIFPPEKAPDIVLFAESGEAVVKQVEARVLKSVWNSEGTNLESVTKNERLDDVLLFDNQPNPFEQSTEIGLTLMAITDVRLEILDMTGRVIDVVLNEKLPAGTHTVTWKVRGQLASGVYFYRLQTDKGHITKRMLLR